MGQGEVMMGYCWNRRIVSSWWSVMEGCGEQGTAGALGINSESNESYTFAMTYVSILLRFFKMFGQRRNH